MGGDGRWEIRRWEMEDANGSVRGRRRSLEVEIDVGLWRGEWGSLITENVKANKYNADVGKCVSIYRKS